MNDKELYHYGIPGMRWGRHKARSETSGRVNKKVWENARRQAETNFLNNIDKMEKTAHAEINASPGSPLAKFFKKRAATFRVVRYASRRYDAVMAEVDMKERAEKDARTKKRYDAEQRLSKKYDDLERDRYLEIKGLPLKEALAKARKIDREIEEAYSKELASMEDE